MKEEGKDKVNIETLKAGDGNNCETTNKAVHQVHNRTKHPKNTEGSQYGDIFHEKETEKTTRTTDQFACYQI